MIFIPQLLCALFPLLISSSIAAKWPHVKDTVHVHVRPISQSNKAPIPYVKIELDFSNASAGKTVVEYGLDPSIISESLVQVGIYDTKTSAFQNSVVTHGSALDSSTESPPLIVLYLSAANDVARVSIHAGEGTGKAGGKSAKTPQVRVEAPSAGPVPELDKPVELDEDGQLPGQEAQKSFLQKYWWIFLGAMVLVMASGGDS
ncbi:MAG: hypothetical protein M1814_000186 [Vezdaea aestivalis]|nr:MAG: hypothetical protein M1814_000186 [Vezdaea aestivalis]